MAIGIFSDHGGEFIIVGHRMWARPDNGHVALQHIEQLWQFINAGAAQPGPDTGDASVIRFGLDDGFAVFEH